MRVHDEANMASTETMKQRQSKLNVGIFLNLKDSPLVTYILQQSCTT